MLNVLNAFSVNGISIPEKKKKKMNHQILSYFSTLKFYIILTRVSQVVI